MSEDDIFKKDYITYFSLTTSVKGVSRITKSDRKSLRAMWLVAVLGFSCVSVSQVYFLLSEYLEYDSTTEFTEEAILQETAYKITVPQLTIYSLSPLSSSANTIADLHSIPKVKIFATRMRELRKCSGCTKEEHAAINITIDRNKTPEGYYQFIGRKSAEKLSHLQETIIAECKLTVFKAYAYVDIPCGDAVSIIPWFSPKYFNCFIVIVEKKKLPLALTPSGFSISLYADHYEPMAMPGSIAMKQSGGFIVSIDNNFQTPFSSATTVVTELNKFTHIAMDQVVIERLSDPYTNCVASANIGTVDDRNDTAAYSRIACIAVCVEERIVEKCECKESQHISILEELNHKKTQGLSFCEDLNLSVQELTRNSRCLDKYRVLVTRECEDICPNLCIDTLFNIYPTSSRWPEIYMMTGFYDQLLKHKPYRDKFPPKEKVNDSIMFW